MVLTAVAFKLQIGSSLPALAYFTTVDSFALLSFLFISIIVFENAVAGSPCEKHLEITSAYCDAADAWFYAGLWLVWLVWVVTFCITHCCCGRRAWGRRAAVKPENRYQEVSDSSSDDESLPTAHAFMADRLP